MIADLQDHLFFDCEVVHEKFNTAYIKSQDLELKKKEKDSFRPEWEKHTIQKSWLRLIKFNQNGKNYINTKFFHVPLNGNYYSPGNLVEIPLPTGCDFPSTGTPKRMSQLKDFSKFIKKFQTVCNLRVWLT